MFIYLQTHLEKERDEDGVCPSQPEGGSSPMDILLKSWPEIGQQSMAHPEIRYYRDLKSIFTKCFYGCGNKRSYVKLKIKNNNSHIGIHSMRSTTQKKKKKKSHKRKDEQGSPLQGLFPDDGLMGVCFFFF